MDDPHQQDYINDENIQGAGQEESNEQGNK